MRAKHEDVERYYRHLAEAYVVDQRAKIEADASDEPTPKYSDDFIKAMNKVVDDLNSVSNEKEAASAEEPTVSFWGILHQRKRINAKKMLAVAAIAALAASVPVVAVANGIDFLQIFRHESTNSVDIYYHDDDVAAQQNVWKITALPNGYEIIDQDVNPTRIQTVYGDPDDVDGPRITLCQYDKAPNIISTDNEQAERKMIELKDTTAIRIEEEFGTAIIWQKNSFYFELVSSLDVNTLITMANSLRMY